VQVHAMDADPYFVDEGDIDAARELVDEAKDAELFLYPGDQHYFADSSLPSYDADAAALLTLANFGECPDHELRQTGVLRSSLRASNAQVTPKIAHLSVHLPP
jgi:hypothetical protein